MAAPDLKPEQVAERKREIADLSKDFPYTRQPNLSLIVLSFNHRSRIPGLLERMRRTCAQELIVCDDGSWDGSLEEWDRRLVRRNDFLLRSNDLHEIRAYDRAIHLAGAPVVCLLQDDDLLPEDGGWADEVLALFEAIPTLAIVSGFYGWSGRMYGNLEPDEPNDFPYLSPVTARSFMYVVETYVGPFFIRKSFYESVGGFDHAYSEPGASGILFEADLCYRAWLAGWRVGLVDCNVKGDAGVHVTPGTWWNEDARSEAQKRNLARLEATYQQPTVNEIVTQVRALNETTLVPAPVVAPSQRQGFILQAGAVLHRERAVLVLGESVRHTVDLVEALVRHGAALIATDTVRLGPQGRIRRPPSATRPDPGAPPVLDISLIVAMRDEPEALWGPVALSGSRAALLILNRIGRAGGTDDRVLHLACALAGRATTLSGSRPGADVSAPLILAFLESAIDRGEGSATGL